MRVKRERERQRKTESVHEKKKKKEERTRKPTDTQTWCRTVSISSRWQAMGRWSARAPSKILNLVSSSVLPFLQERLLRVSREENALRMTAEGGTEERKRKTRKQNRRRKEVLPCEWSIGRRCCAAEPEYLFQFLDPRLVSLVDDGFLCVCV